MRIERARALKAYLHEVGERDAEYVHVKKPVCETLVDTPVKRDSDDQEKVSVPKNDRT